MAAFDIEEHRPLIFRHEIPEKVSDSRWPYQKQVAMYFILASTLFERIAFYSLVTNTVLILKSPEFAWNAPHSATALYIFSGTSYISTILFAAISDAKLGRAKTIIIGFIPYLMGYVMLILLLDHQTNMTLCEPFGWRISFVFSEYCDLPIIATFVCIAIGAGAVQSNMAVFGAEQIQEVEITSRYFDKYVVAVNIGGAIAMLIIPYFGRAHVYIGSIIAAGMLFFALVLFIVGYRYYLHVPPYDSVLTTCIPVAINACQSWCRYKRKKRSREIERLNSTTMNIMDASPSGSNIEASGRIQGPRLTFLDFAKVPNQGKFLDRVVDNVKVIPSALAVFILLIPYWLIYNQSASTFPLQGEQMYTPNGKTMITLMSLADPITIILGILLLNIFVYKYVDTKNPGAMLTTKFVIGMCLAAITMCIAGVVECFRQKQCDHHLKMNVSNLTIYTQLPQNIGMGLSELFAMVASYEFAYLAAPRSAQSLFMSLRFCSSGVASLIGSLYINLFPKSDVYINFDCQSDKSWQWSFYSYFFILAGVQLAFILILIICQKYFQIIKPHPEKTQHHRFV